MARTAIVTRQDAVLLGGWPVAHQARGSVITVRVCVPGFITGALLLTDRLAPLAVWLRHEEPADLPAPLPAATSATADTTAVVPNRSPPAGHRRVPPDLTNTLRAAWARVRTRSGSCVLRGGVTHVGFVVARLATARALLLILVAGEHDREPSDDHGEQRPDAEEGPPATMWGMAKSHLTSGSHRLRSCLASG